MNYIVELFVVHLCELEDIVGPAAPRRRQDQKHEVRHVQTSETGYRYLSGILTFTQLNTMHVSHVSIMVSLNGIH